MNMTIDLNTLISTVTLLGVSFVGFILKNIGTDIREIRSSVLKHVTDREAHCKEFNHSKQGG